MYVYNIFVGFGVFAKSSIRKGDFLLQYSGEKITSEEAALRQKKTAENKMFFYVFHEKTWW